MTDACRQRLFAALRAVRAIFWQAAVLASVLRHASFAAALTTSCNASIVPYRRPSTRLQQAAIAHLSLQRLGARNAAPQLPTDPEPKKLD